MKLQTMLASAMITGLLSLNTYAADTDKAAMPEAATKASGQKVKKHSHMEEKMGHVQQGKEAVADDKAEKTNAAHDKSKHYHPRDGK